MTQATGAVTVLEVYRFFHAGPEEVLALRGVTLAVAPGEMIALAGPSGSGKSTLLAAMAGLDDPDGGQVYVAGEQISHRPEADRSRLRRARVGVLYQDENLLPHLTVAQNVKLAQQLTGRRRADPLGPLERVGIAHRARSLPEQLSGGELARAGLAVALAGEPRVLLADEPTAELDASAETDLLGVLRALTTGGVAVVLATHSPRVMAVADRIVRLTDGRVQP